MKIFIPSYNRAQTISTHKIFDACGLDYRILLHNEKQLSDYLKNPTIDPSKVIVTNTPLGIPHQRNFMKFELTFPGDWFITADDNITSIQAFPEPYYTEEKHAFREAAYELQGEERRAFQKKLEGNIIDGNRVMEICEETVKKAEEIGAKMCGFSTQLNYFFRQKKWRTVGYVITKLAILYHDDIIFDPEIRVMDDYGYTAENIKRYGKVLINYNMHPLSTHYQQGGIGKYNERLPYKLADAKRLIEKYPGLLAYKVKKNCHPEAELRFRFINEKQVEIWRNGLQTQVG